MKTSMYAALFAVIATAIAATAAGATPSNDMLTTSGPPRALRVTKPSQPITQKSVTIDVPKLKADNIQPTASSATSPAVMAPVVSGSSYVVAG